MAIHLLSSGISGGMSCLDSVVLTHGKILSENREMCQEGGRQPDISRASEKID